MCRRPNPAQGRVRVTTKPVGGVWAPPKQIRAASTICMQCNLLVCSTHSVVITCGTMRAIMIGLVLAVQCNILRNRFKHLLSSTASDGGHPQSLFLKQSFTFSLFFDFGNIAVEHFCTCANILKEGAGTFLKDFDTGWVTGWTQYKNVIRSALQGSAS